MKKILTLLLTCGICLFAQAVPTTFNLTLAWNINLPEDAVTKYTLYQATGLTGAFSKVADITDGSTQYVVQNMLPGVYRFQVTASNVWGESPPSNTVDTPASAPGAPRILTIRVTANP